MKNKQLERLKSKCDEKQLAKLKDYTCLGRGCYVLNLKDPNKWAGRSAVTVKSDDIALAILSVSAPEM